MSASECPTVIAALVLRAAFLSHWAGLDDCVCRMPMRGRRRCSIDTSERALQSATACAVESTDCIRIQASDRMPTACWCSVRGRKDVWTSIARFGASASLLQMCLQRCQSGRLSCND